MRVKLFISLSILFYFNFIQKILSAEYNVTLAYRKLVVDKMENNNKFTNFCLVNNRKTLAYICYRAYEQIRRNHPYNDVYFQPMLTEEYPECFEESVELENTTSVIQNLKECPGGSVVVQDHGKATYRPAALHKKILVFALTLQNIFIFRRKESENSVYFVSDWFIEPNYSFNVESKTSPIFAKNRIIPPNLFQILPPRSIDLESWHSHVAEKNLSKTCNKRNIVHKSDPKSIAKLCMIALRRAQYPDIIVDVISHAKVKKTKAINVKVKIGRKLVNTKALLCYTYKIVAHFTINELKQIFSQDEVEKLKSFKMKDDVLGYELSPQDIKKALNLNFDMLTKKMDKIEYMLTVTSNPITYFLDHVSDKNSVGIIRKMTADENQMEYKRLETITNICDEYLERMDLNNETEFLLKLQKLQILERQVFEKRKYDNQYSQIIYDATADYYDRKIEEIHEENKRE